MNEGSRKQNLKSRILSVLLAICMVLTLTPVLGFQQEVKAETISSTSTFTVTKSDGSRANYDVTLDKSATWDSSTHVGGNYNATVNLNLSGFSNFIEAQMKDVVLIMDTSTSMSGQKAIACANGAKNFINEYLTKFPSSRIAVTAFNGRAQADGSSYCTFNSNKSTLCAVVDEAYLVDKNGKTNVSSHSGTNYEAGFRSAYDLMHDAGMTQDDVSLVFISDGAPNSICKNGDMTIRKSVSSSTALKEAETFILGHFNRAEIFTLSYDVSSSSALQTLRKIATVDPATGNPYHFNSANYSGSADDKFVALFNSVLNVMVTLPIRVSDYLSEYFEVNTNKLINTTAATYNVQNQNVDGKSLQLVTVTTSSDAAANQATIQIPVVLKSAYRNKDATYATNYDRVNDPGALVTFNAGASEYSLSVGSPHLSTTAGGGGAPDGSVTNKETITVRLNDGTTSTHDVYLTKSAQWQDGNHARNNYNADITMDFSGFSDIAYSKRSDVILIMDTSTSMSGNPALACAAGAKNFVQLFKKRYPSARIAITAFNGMAQTEAAPYCSFTRNTATLNDTIDRAYCVGKNGRTNTSSHCGSNYEAGFRSAYNLMLKAGLSSSQVSLVFFGDGKPNYVCKSGDINTKKSVGFNTAKNAALSFIDDYFRNTQIFVTSYNVTKLMYETTLREIATDDPITAEDYYYNASDYSGTLDERFVKMFESVIVNLSAVNITFSDYISEYYTVDQTRLPNIAGVTYRISTERIDGKTLQKVTVTMSGDIASNSAVITIPVTLKSEYQNVSMMESHKTNYDRTNYPGAQVDFSVQVNGGNADSYNIGVTSPSLS